MKNLYEFHWDCGYGDLYGRFLATEDEIKKLIGMDINFGEVLGKHSEIYGSIDEADINLVTDNKEFLEMAEKLDIDLTLGYSPLDFLLCKECEDYGVTDVITMLCDECAEENWGK